MTDMTLHGLYGQWGLWILGVGTCSGGERGVGEVGVAEVPIFHMWRGCPGKQPRQTLRWGKSEAGLRQKRWRQDSAR